MATTLLKKQQKKQMGSNSIVYAGKGNGMMIKDGKIEKVNSSYVIGISFKNKTTMKNFIEDFEMSQNESIKNGAEDALKYIKNGKTSSLNAFLKKHGAKI